MNNNLYNIRRVQRDSTLPLLLIIVILKKYGKALKTCRYYCRLIIFTLRSTAHAEDYERYWIFWTFVSFSFLASWSSGLSARQITEFFLRNLTKSRQKANCDCEIINRLKPASNAVGSGSLFRLQIRSRPATRVVDLDFFQIFWIGRKNSDRNFWQLLRFPKTIKKVNTRQK